MTLCTVNAQKTFQYSTSFFTYVVHVIHYIHCLIRNIISCLFLLCIMFMSIHLILGMNKLSEQTLSHYILNSLFLHLYCHESKYIIYILRERDSVC